MTNNSHRRSYFWTYPATAFALIAGALIVTSFQSLTAAEIITDPAAKEVEYESSVFRPDPAYEDVGYDSEAQLEIYGGKSAFPTPRPLIELGREMYTVGSYEEAGTFLGARLYFHLSFRKYSINSKCEQAINTYMGGTRSCKARSC